MFLWSSYGCWLNVNFRWCGAKCLDLDVRKYLHNNQHWSTNKITIVFLHFCCQIAMMWFQHWQHQHETVNLQLFASCCSTTLTAAAAPSISIPELRCGFSIDDIDKKFWTCSSLRPAAPQRSLRLLLRQYPYQRCVVVSWRYISLSVRIKEKEKGRFFSMFERERIDLH